MQLRNYKTSDAKACWALFFHTVHTVTAADYTDAQRNAWAPADFSMQTWQQRLDTIRPIIAEEDGHLAGYADLQADGLIDHFFVSVHYQKCGVGRFLMEEIVRRAKEKNMARLYAHVSKTAKSFFEKNGFAVERKQEVAIGGITLTNYVMSRQISPEQP